MKKKLNIRRVIVTIEIIVLIILIGFLGVKVYKDFFKKNTEDPTNVVVQKSSIKEYGYVLEDRDTKLFEEYYKELEKVLNEKEIDYQKYCELVAKLYITDFYTLSNKLTSTDIGALEFIHPNSISNFVLKAGDTIYKNVLSNLYNERTQILPEVSEVIVDSITPTTFSYAGVEYEAYDANINWKYKEDMGYDTSKILTIIKVDKRLYVVSAK